VRRIIGAVGVAGGLGFLLGVFLPWYPASGRFGAFSCLTLLLTRQEGSLNLQLFLMLFGGFTILLGGLFSSFLPRRDTLLVLLSGVIISSVSVALVLNYIKGGFSLVNPREGLYNFYTSPAKYWSVVFSDLSYGFYFSLAGILAATADLSAAILMKERSWR
jgi:hypothetical protein